MKATAQIFLSYAQEDEEKVENLYQELSDAGFKPWMDKKDILPGEKWKSSIQTAIRRSDFFLACLSVNSVSKRGFLQKEIKDALDVWQEKLEGDIYLIPARLEDCKVPESLDGFQWVNLFEEDGWTRLVKAIRIGMQRLEKTIKPVEQEPTPFEPCPAHEKPSAGTEMAKPEEGPKQALVFLATAWGSKYGGVSSFNKDLCVALATLLPDRYHVVCVVLEASQDETLDAKKTGIELIALGPSEQKSSFEEHRAYEVIAKINERSLGTVLWWIGHDVITGDVAIAARRLSKSGKSAVIHHMNYEAYISFKDGDSEDARTKIEQQREVLTHADLVMAVGPKLADSARDKIRGKSTAQVVELIPGLAQIKGVDSPTVFKAITFGRMDPRNDRVKQASLAVEAFGDARGIRQDPLGFDASLTVIGLSDDKNEQEHQEFLALAEKRAGRAVPIHGWPYLDDQDRLFDHLRRHTVCLMLSLHEGFGLTGWEAIAAEVPLIVSKNSGAYETIDRLLGGMGIGCVNAVELLGSTGKQPFKESDVEAVSKALIGIRKRGSRAKNDARVLKHNLLKIRCTWQHTALTLAEACELDVAEELADLNLRRWQPNMLVDALQYSTDMVDNIARRKSHFQQIWDKMKPPSAFTRRLVLFGGVATALCNEDTAKKYAEWLEDNPDARLYICYESGPSAKARAKKLNQELLDTFGGLLPVDAELRMLAKEKQVLALKDLLAKILGDSYREISDRISFIPLVESLTTYIMITDNDVFLTPLLQTRSSETLTFALSRRPVQFRLDVFNYLIYHLETLEDPGLAADLISELRTLMASLDS